MKKFIVSLALLGLFSVGTMAVIHHDSDEPPTRQTEQRRGHHGWHDDCDGRHRHHRWGGCCGDYHRDDCRRDDRCCDERYRCDACRYDRCTVDGCHERGELCPECAKWCEAHRRADGCCRR